METHAYQPATNDVIRCVVCGQQENRPIHLVK